MTSLASHAANAIVSAYDFSRFDLVADVGGSYGALLIAIRMPTQSYGVCFSTFRTW
jgi:hypothetical protein